VVETHSPSPQTFGGHPVEAILSHKIPAKPDGQEQKNDPIKSKHLALF